MGEIHKSPEIFFAILKKGKNKLIKLKEVAKVRFGIKTGANEFFYLTEDEIKRRKIENQYLQPVIFSLKEVKGYKLNKRNLKNKVIICHKTKEKLRSTNLLKYIEWGEKQGFHKRPTCSSRSPLPWYSLGKDWDYAPIIFPAKVGERMPVFLNNDVFEDKKLYGILPLHTDEMLILAAILNSTLFRFFVEFSCRQLTGSQAIADIDVAVVEATPIININCISGTTKSKLCEKFENLLQTDCESIFKEIGFEPQNIELSKIKFALRELDKIIMGDILGLTDEEQIEVYRAVIDLVKSRIEKAKSVDSKSKTKEGIDIDMLVRTVMEKIGSETIGKFYTEKILSQKELSIRTIPQPVENVAVKKGLFGWEVHFGKKHISCDSEREAEYIKILAETGLEKVKIPREPKYLKEIFPELEGLKKKTDKTINEYLSSILDRKLREKLLHYIWQEVMKIE